MGGGVYHGESVLEAIKVKLTIVRSGCDKYR
jgi:hypothetical protein